MEEKTENCVEERCSNEAGGCKLGLDSSSNSNSRDHSSEGNVRMLDAQAKGSPPPTESHDPSPGRNHVDAGNSQDRVLVDVSVMSKAKGSTAPAREQGAELGCVDGEGVSFFA